METLADRVERMLSGPRPLPLVFAGDPVLRTPASVYDYSLPDDLWSELIESMFQTMRAAPGVGLAAPQIGLGIRVAVLEDAAELPPELAAARQRFPTAPRVLVNPRYDALQDGDRRYGDPQYGGPLYGDRRYDDPERGAPPFDNNSPEYGNSHESAAAVPAPGTPAAVDGPTAEFYEGCLSVPGYQAVVRRSKTVRLRCSDERGNVVDESVTGWAARIVAHETDHLDGILYLDRAMTRSLASTTNLVDLWAGATLADIRRALRF